MRRFHGLCTLIRSIVLLRFITRSPELGRFATANPTKSTSTSAFVSSRKHSIFSSEFASKLKLQEGDEVMMQDGAGNSSIGFIHQNRGSGWYAVQLDDGSIKKIRRSQLLLRPPPMVDTETSSANVPSPDPPSVSPLGGHLSASCVSSKQANGPKPLPPTIHDLDALMDSTDADEVLNKHGKSLLEQCRHHASFDKWVVFSDLHCQTSSLPTCLEVLERVHHEAKARGAGILFLGDFWHHRGSIRVDLLNSVLQGLSFFEVPMIMIPGNHDQVTLGGYNHGLTPLKHAYRVGLPGGRTVPGPLIFSFPTKFRDALFVPHIRQNSIMESVLWSQESRDSKALFVHSDVTGAQMNDLVVSTSGVSPDIFPQHKPVYSGHFHLMHNVTTTLCRTIQYVGSPYQTSLSEAQQKKGLWVLDASRGWICDELIPVSIGRRFFKAAWGKTPIQVNDISPMDRVVLSIPKALLETMRLDDPNGSPSPFDAYVQQLRLAGATVEVEQTIPAVDQRRQKDDNVEALEPRNVLRLYLNDEVIMERMSEKTAESLLQSGIKVLEEAAEHNELSLHERLGQSNELRLSHVTLEGFGPFRAKVSYPLGDRGLVLLCGSSRDAGADSNGSGKSTLAMASLWALTNTIDARPVDDARIFDIINEESKVAKVTLRGIINGEPFIISRSKSKSKSSLSFHLGEEELTAQSQRDTQQQINTKLGIVPDMLSRSMFHGQHNKKGLLEATDGQLKDELSLLVPLGVWQLCASVARARGRKASKRITELETIISLRAEDVGSLQKRCRTVDSEAQQMQLEIEKDQQALEKLRARQSLKASPKELMKTVKETAADLSSVESAVQALEQRRAADVRRVQQAFDAETRLLVEANAKLQRFLREKTSARAKAESAEMLLNSTRTRWRRPHHVSDKDPNHNSGLCPVCSQPIKDKISLVKAMDSEFEAIKEQVKETQAALVLAEAAVCKIEADAEAIKARVESTRKEMVTTNGKWALILEDRCDQLRKARLAHSDAVDEFSTIVPNNVDSEVRELESIMTVKHESLHAKQKMQASNTQAIVDLQESLEEMKKELNMQKHDASQMELLANAVGPKGVQTFILRSTVARLEEVTQGYLDHLSDGSQKVVLSLEDGDKIVRRALIRRQDGTYSERPLSSLSGGQWRRCALALSFGFADLMAARGRLRPSLVVLDEPLTHLDRIGRLRVGSLLRKMLRSGCSDCGKVHLYQQRITPSTIILILQDMASFDLEEDFDAIDEVVRESGESSVSVDGQLEPPFTVDAFI